MPRSVLVLGVVLTLAVVAAARPHIASTAAACEADDPPSIRSISPSSIAPLSVISLAGCNLHGSFPDECDAFVGGVQAYIETDCNDTDTQLVIPIAATQGSIVLTVAGVQTEPFAFDLLPLREYGPWNIIPGRLSVAVRPDVDFRDVMRVVGPVAGDLGSEPTSLCYDVCLYFPRVPAGEEVEAAIAYYSDPRVLFAELDPVACIPESPSCGEKPTDTSSAVAPVTPRALPVTGDDSSHPEGWQSVAVIIGGLTILTSAGYVLAARKRREESEAE